MDLLTTHQTDALDFKNHISLTANAGSGKTFVLSRRYLEIALSEKGSLWKIAAITFTDKAASELYKKIADNIENRFDNADNDEEKIILSKIRRQLVSASISTIHSFCIDILRQFPVEAGLDANFQAVDETASDEMIELSIDEIIKESLSGDSYTTDTKYLVRFFRSRFNLASQLRRLIKDRKKVFELQNTVYNRDENYLTEYFHKTFIQTAEKLIQIDQDEFINSFSAINENVLSANKNNNNRAIEIKKLLNDFKKEKDVITKIGIIHLLKIQGFTKNGEVRKTGYLSNNLREGLSREIKLSEDYVTGISSFDIPDNHMEIGHELAKFGLAILRLFDNAVKKYELKKKENGYLDYEDILIHTKNLLKIPSVKAEISRRYKYIMVDEYQDTNEIQYKIFLPILDDLKEGNLFVVGDEKQSIYMFRDADLEVFRITKDRISEAAGKRFLLNLPDSFRMAPGICLFVNKVFRNLFSDPVELFNEVGHSDLVCAKGEDTESIIEILIGISVSDEENDKTGELTEAELVADKIIKLVNGTGIKKNLNWKDIAVLVRKRKSFSSLEKIFIEKNIPFNIVGGKGFYQRQPVYDIYNYFSFLLDKKNDTALAGILRSPFFNIPDSTIYELFLENGETLWEKLSNQDPADERIKKVIGILKRNIALTSVYTPSQILRRIIGESPYLSALAQKASGAQETANIYKLIRLTINFQSRGFRTLYDYVNFLRESIEASEDEAQAAVADESDSVKVMTIHQAKGLEYPAVFLYNAHDATVSDKIKKGIIRVDKNFGLLTKVPLRNDYFNDYYSAPICKVFDFIAEKKEIAEVKRLFYVGATRAKNYLFISAADTEKYKPGSFIALMQESMNMDLTGNNFIIKDNVKFLKTEGNKFINYSSSVEKEIPIIRSTGDNDLYTENIPEEQKINHILISGVNDLPKGEIISATKFAVFKQCPIKYMLTYDLGIAGLIKDYSKYRQDIKNSQGNEFEFNFKENIQDAEDKEKIFLPAELKGKIIHKILQNNKTDISTDEIGKLIKDESQIEDTGWLDSLQSEIFSQLQNLFASDIYRKIMSHEKSYNEYEIYLNEESYFLHGILDKLIIDGKKAIIVDYKTDSIQKEEIFNRASLYFPQLKFYSYIVSRLFKELTSFELRLIFIRFPGEDVKEILNRDEAASFGQEIEDMVTSVRTRKYEQNLLQCRECNSALENLKCIVERA